MDERGSDRLTPIQKRIEIAKETKKLEIMRKAVEDAASVSTGLWLSYLFVFFYIALATYSVTHVDLLLQNPVRLPFLNIELSLLAFFTLAPFLFVVVHVHTLLHFVMLAAKVGQFDEALKKQLEGANDVQETIRRQLPSNI